jgi:oligopeptidase B
LSLMKKQAHNVGLSTYYEFDADSIVVSYDSLITPPCSSEISLAKPGERTVLKAKNVPGYDKSVYGCDRLTVKSQWISPS